MEKRVIEIETKLAFAEQTIEELSAELYHHQKKLAKLEESFSQLKQQMTKLSEHAGPISHEDEIPPHY